jgi:hypothetical protein
MHPPTLLLIDAGLPDLQVLLAGVDAGMRPLLVGRDEDALEIVQREIQAAALTAAGAPSRLAIVAHGAAGAVLIGREPIERASLAARAAAWAALGQGALRSIDLFACHAGADQGFVEAFAAISGCAVAASRRAVGHDQLGADWQLDVVASHAEGAASAAANGVVPFSRAACEAWGHSLALPTYTVAQLASIPFISQSLGGFIKTGGGAAPVNNYNPHSSAYNPFGSATPTIGPFASDSNGAGADISRNLTNPSQDVFLRFNLFRVDNWEPNESFTAFLNDQPIFTMAGFGPGSSSIKDQQGITNGYRWTATSDFSGYYGRDGGEKVTVKVFLPTVASGNYKIGFGSTLDQAESDEFWGINNIDLVSAYTLQDTAANITANTTASIKAALYANDITVTGTTSFLQARTIANFLPPGTLSFNLISDNTDDLAYNYGSFVDYSGSYGINNYVFDRADTVVATTDATVAKANVLAGFTKPVAYNISDRASNIAAASAAVRDDAVNITATTAATVAEATTIVNATNSGTNSFSISDTAAAIHAANAAVLNDALNLTATDTATVAQSTTLVNATNTGTNTYNLSDTATNLIGAPAAVGNGAVTIVATTAATVVEATAIEAFTNTSTTTYNISDTATNLAASSNAVLTLAGTVTASTDATFAEALTISAWTKPIVYNIRDTALNLTSITSTAGDRARNEAVNITATDSATVIQATRIVNASNSGTNTYNLSDSASNLAAAAAVGSGAGTITATTSATLAEATTIDGFTNTAGRLRRIARAETVGKQ